MAGHAGPFHRCLRHVCGLAPSPEGIACIGGLFQAHTPASRGTVYIYATDVRATLDTIDASGGKRMGDAMALPGMATFGYFSDPSGPMMGLIGG